MKKDVLKQSTHEYTLAWQGFVFWVFFLVAVTSAPLAELWISRYSITPYQRNTVHCLWCWTCDQHNHKTTELHLSKVSHPADRREEYHLIIPLHIFSIVIAAPRLAEAKAHSQIVHTTFYQLAAGRSALTKDKKLDKGSLLKHKISGKLY